jgi:hypothetical protein
MEIKYREQLTNERSRGQRKTPSGSSDQERAEEQKGLAKLYRTDEGSDKAS